MSPSLPETGGTLRRRAAVLLVLLAVVSTTPVMVPGVAHGDRHGCREAVGSPAELAGEVTGRADARYCPSGTRHVRIRACLQKIRWWGLQTIGCSQGGWAVADTYVTRPVTVDCGRAGDRYRWMVNGRYEYDLDGDLRGDHVVERWGPTRELVCEA